MTKQDQNFEIWSGDHKNLVAAITGSDGAAQDMTGMTIEWIMRPAAEAASLVRRTSAVSGGISISTSTLTISMSPADTVSLGGTYWHECSASDTDSNVATLFTGWATVNRR